MNINIASEIPHQRQKSYKMNPEALKVLHEEIDTLIEKGYIIECNENNNKWLSQARVIKNKKGEWIFTMDFTELNSFIRTSYYPVHRPRKILQKLKNARKISTFKMYKGFHQIPIVPEDQNKTVFKVEGRCGFYKWLRLPYGLKGGSETFCRLVDQVKESISKRMTLLHPNIRIDDKIFVCLETWIIISETIEEHMILIKGLFDELKESKLNLDTKQCEFIKETLNYNGFTIDYNGLHVCQESIQPIIDYPQPKNLKAIRQFNGMVNYYRNHIKDIAMIQEPLNKFYATNAIWEWTEIEERAFQKTKTALSNASSLSMLDIDLPFRLYPYVTCSGRGAKLVQYDAKNDRENLIVYKSKIFSKTEKTYPALDKQISSILWALSEVQYLIEGRAIEVFTDPSVLMWCASKEKGSHRLNQWAKILPKCNILLIADVDDLSCLFQRSL